MINWKVRLLRPDSHKRVSGIPGAVHSASHMNSLQFLCSFAAWFQALQRSLNFRFWILLLKTIRYSGIAAQPPGPASISLDTQRFHDGNGAIHIDVCHSTLFMPGSQNKETQTGIFVKFHSYVSGPTSRQIAGHFCRTPRGFGWEQRKTMISRLRYRQFFDPNDPPPNQWHEFLIRMTEPLPGKKRWLGLQTCPKSKSFFEIFTDTWDLGFNLWLDGLGFLEIFQNLHLSGRTGTVRDLALYANRKWHDGSWCGGRPGLYDHRLEIQCADRGQCRFKSSDFGPFCRLNHDLRCCSGYGD